MIEDVALTTANDNVSDLKMSKREYSMKIKGGSNKKTGPPAEANDPVLNHFNLND